MLLLPFYLVAAVAAGDGCPMALNTGSVGSCMVSDCAASRGPTYCRWGTCWCKSGFCRYPASSIHVQERYCVARVPDETCHVSRVCYNAGLTTTFCGKGLCMCKWGYAVTYDDDGNPECTPAAGVNLAAHNTTADIEFMKQQDDMVTLNVLLFSAWVAFFATVVTGLAVVVYRKLRAPEENDYMPLLACE
uniref:EB domain-containing protein n=1 Tax=Karlodinium veneficum TaxID=407301 RepID=A7WQ02_KARVE|nr:unknown [Karlodinium veneficum]